MAVKDYSTTPADNNKTPPNGAPEGMSPSSVNDTMRQMMADTRDFYNNLEWRDWGYTPSYVSSTSFSLDGDMTALCSENRRVKLVGSGMGTIYGTITGAVYASTVTTVTVDLDSGSITSGLTNVLFGIDMSNSPINIPDPVYDAVDINFDNSESGLDADNVQDAIDEIITDFDNALENCQPLNPRTFVTAATGNVTPSYDYDAYIITSQNGPIIFVNPTTLVQGQAFVIRIKDNGTARAFTWESKYRGIGVDLPTGTTAGKVMYISCIYNTTENKVDVTGVAEQA